MKVMSEWRRKRTEKILLRNRNYKKLIYNRLIITFALVIVQLALSGFLLFTFYEWSSRLILFLIDFIGLICVLYILNHDEKPSSKLNWIIIILIFPFFGVFAYVIFGEGRPTRKMNKKICASKKENMQVLKRSVSKADEAALQGRSSETCRYLHDFAGYPAYADGDVEYYETGEKMFPKMLEELEKAEKFILASECKKWGVKFSCLPWQTNQSATMHHARKAIMQVAYVSRAKYVILPLQDLLGTGAESRLNSPGTLGTWNWSWRYQESALNDTLAEEIHRAVRKGKR